MSNSHEAIKHAQLTKTASQVIDSEQLWAVVNISGIDKNTGNFFDCDFTFTEKDPEFQKFINEWATRKIAERLLKNANG